MAAAIAAIGAVGRAQDFTVAARLEGELPIGDRLQVELLALNPDFKADRIVRVVIESPSEEWHLAEPWERRENVGRVARSTGWTATLQGFKTGRVKLPTFVVVFRDGAGDEDESLAEGGEVEIRSARAEGEEKEQFFGLRDVRQEGRQWRRSLLTVLAALIVASAATALIAWIARLRARRPAPEAPPAPPVILGPWAMREINRRSRLPLSGPEAEKELATLSSEIVRRYLGLRYGFEAIDLTTLECLEALRERRTGAEAVEVVEAFLGECDMMKFCKLRPPPERRPAIWDAARKIVRLTTPPREWESLAEARAPLGRTAEAKA
jgi:hypothetical protein